MQRYSVKKKKIFKKGHAQYQKQWTIVIENSDELTIGWARSEVMIQYRSLAVPPPPPLSPYNKNIYHFQQCNKCFQCIIHIYTDMSPRFKCVSHHTCVSSPRGGSSRVLCVHTCIYIRIYINTCVWTTCKPHHHHLGSSFDIIGAGRKTIGTKRSSRRRSLTMNTRLCLFLPVAPL